MTIDLALNNISIGLRTDDLDLVKESVKFLNENFTPTDEYRSLDDIILSGPNSFPGYNPSFDYILDNLKFLESAKKIKFRRMVQYLLMDGTNEEKYDFINNEINKIQNDLINENFYMKDLIKLANSTNDVNLLKKINNFLIKEES